MSAVPKKKLCWNCEGNVSREIDNCPYCGVYLHAADQEENSNWNPSYRPSSKLEEIPSPLYKMQPEDSSEQESIEEEENNDEDDRSFAWGALLTHFKRDICPVLFLMGGSIFFLFGIVLLLFSQNGTFTLQWKERDGLYFLVFALPLMILGWRFFQKMDANE